MKKPLFQNIIKSKKIRPLKGGYSPQFNRIEALQELEYFEDLNILNDDNKIDEKEYLQSMEDRSDQENIKSM